MSSNNQSTDGVIYLLGPAGYAELLCVSLYTLRKHFNGPASVFCTDAESLEICHRMAKDERLGLTVRRAEQPNKLRHATYCTKPVVSLLTPYDRTVFLDCDTLVAGDFSELFEPELALVQFSNWVSTGKRISGRISQWLKVSELAKALATIQLHTEYKAINTGIFGFHKSHLDFIRAWRDLTLEGQRCSFTDELAMQLMMTAHLPIDLKCFDDRFNLSPRYGIGRADPRIWHLHGRGHMRKEEGKAMWWPIFYEAIAAGWGKLDEWAGEYDKHVQFGMRV